MAERPGIDIFGVPLRMSGQHLIQIVAFCVGLGIVWQQLDSRVTRVEQQLGELRDAVADRTAQSQADVAKVAGTVEALSARVGALEQTNARVDERTKAMQETLQELVRQIRYAKGRGSLEVDRGG